MLQRRRIGTLYSLYGSDSEAILTAFRHKGTNLVRETDLRRTGYKNPTAYTLEQALRSLRSILRATTSPGRDS